MKLVPDVAVKRSPTDPAKPKQGSCCNSNQKQESTKAESPTIPNGICEQDSCNDEEKGDAGSNQQQRVSHLTILLRRAREGPPNSTPRLSPAPPPPAS